MNEISKIAESETEIILTQRESMRLLEMVENPPLRNERFLQAQARYQAIKSKADNGASGD